MRETVEKLWQGYAAATQVPMGGVQWKETRLAFYAGVWSYMNEALRAPELASDRDDADGVAWMNACFEECRRFHERYLAAERTKEHP